MRPSAPPRQKQPQILGPPVPSCTGSFTSSGHHELSWEHRNVLRRPGTLGMGSRPLIYLRPVWDPFSSGSNSSCGWGSRVSAVENRKDTGCCPEPRETRRPSHRGGWEGLWLGSEGLSDPHW